MTINWICQKALERPTVIAPIVTSTPLDLALTDPPLKLAKPNWNLAATMAASICSGNYWHGRGGPGKIREPLQSVST
jgi:hypothetical protein